MRPSGSTAVESDRDRCRSPGQFLILGSQRKKRAARSELAGIAFTWPNKTGLGEVPTGHYWSGGRN